MTHDPPTNDQHSKYEVLWQCPKCPHQRWAQAEYGGVWHEYGKGRKKHQLRKTEET